MCLLSHKIQFISYCGLWLKKESWKVTAFANTVHKSVFFLGYLYQLKTFSHRDIKWGCVGLPAHVMCWVRGAFSWINQGSKVNLAWFVLCEPMLIPNYHCSKTIYLFFCLIRCSQAQQRKELKLFMSLFFHTPYFDRFDNCPSLVFDASLVPFHCSVIMRNWSTVCPPCSFRTQGGGCLELGIWALGRQPAARGSLLLFPNLCFFLVWWQFISTVVPEAQQELRESPFHQLIRKCFLSFSSSAKIHLYLFVTLKLLL